MKSKNNSDEKACKACKENTSDILKIGDFIHNISMITYGPLTDDIKQMSKQEIAESMHHEGVLSAVTFFVHNKLPQGYIERTKNIIEEFSSSKKMKAFEQQAQKTVDTLAAISDKLAKMGISDKEFDRVIKSLDPKNFMAFEGADLATEDGIAIAMNELVFRKDWQKQLEWTRLHGNKGDIDVVRNLMSKN